MPDAPTPEPVSKAAKLLETEEPREPVAPRVTKKIAVTFDTGLPMGTCARFTHEGEIWVAYPSTKSRRILTVMDRLLGVFDGFTDNAVRILNRHPGNTGVQELAVATLQSQQAAEQLWYDLAVEKVKAVTS